MSCVPVWLHRGDLIPTTWSERASTWWHSRQTYPRMRRRSFFYRARYCKTNMREVEIKMCVNECYQRLTIPQQE